jgi:hypothetical protein
VNVFCEVGWIPWTRVISVFVLHENMLASMMCLTFVEN